MATSHVSSSSTTASVQPDLFAPFLAANAKPEIVHAASNIISRLLNSMEPSFLLKNYQVNHHPHWQL